MNQLINNYEIPENIRDTLQHDNNRIDQNEDIFMSDED